MKASSTNFTNFGKTQFWEYVWLYVELSYLDPVKFTCARMSLEMNEARIVKKLVAINERKMNQGKSKFSSQSNNHDEDTDEVSSVSEEGTDTDEDDVTSTMYSCITVTWPEGE